MDAVAINLKVDLSMNLTCTDTEPETTTQGANMANCLIPLRNLIYHLVMNLEIDILVSVATILSTCT